MGRTIFSTLLMVVSAGWTMLTPCGRAQGATNECLTPYTAFAWTAAPGYQHLPPMIWINSQSDPTQVASELSAVPSGERLLFFCHAEDMLLGNPLDFVPGTTYQSPWIDHGAEVAAKWSNNFYAKIKAAGATVDFVATDDEGNLSMWAIPQAQIDAIAADSRFAKLAKTYNLENIGTITNGGAQAMTWNAVMGMLLNQGFRKGLFEPLHKYFPNAGFSNYSDQVLSPGLAPLAPDYNGWPQPSFAPLRGTHQSPMFYSQVGQLAWPGRAGSIANFSASPMPTLIWEVDQMRSFALAGKPIIPWIDPKSFQESGYISLLANSPYYDELVYHLMLSSGSTNFLFWNPNATASDDAAMNNDLTTLAAETGFSKTLTPLVLDHVSFASSILISGVQVDAGTRVYRVTLPPGQTTASVALPGQKTPQLISVDSSGVGQWVVLKKGG